MARRAKNGEQSSTSLSGLLSDSGVLQCRRKFLERLRRMAVGEVHAWCSLRMRRGYTSDPSPAETQEFLQGYRQGSEILEYKAIISAFERGAEVCSLLWCRLRVVGLTAGSTNSNSISK